ncbi:MAG: glycosyltransferase family 39 protein [Deltaproteobacteria bacterium]|nr:glycosyltransferase family 39 protein [Deltaproteobacteria bacterium]
MPLYPVLIAIVHLIIPNWVMAARLISYTSLVLLVIPLYHIINHLFGRGAAFWGCFAFVLAPIPNGWVVDVIRGPSFVFVFAWAVYFALLAVCSKGMKGIKYFFIAAFFGWLAVCLRIEGIIFIPFYFLFLLGLTISKNRERPYFLKGILIWIIFPLFLSSILLVFFGTEIMSYNRWGEVWFGVNDIFHLEFLDNYYRIYGHLKTIENSPPMYGWHQNFAGIARHYILVIYFFELLRTLIKVIFPFFVVSLIWGFRDSLSRSRLFLLLLVFVYLFMIYYSFVTKGFIQKRFLFFPAFLLYVWIGRGIERMFMLARQSVRPQLFAVVFTVLFFISPVYKSVHFIGKQDNVINRTGKWLATRPEFAEAKIATNDPRILFYAGRKTFGGNTKDFLPYAKLIHEYSSIEQLAAKNRKDILIIGISSKGKDMLSGFKHYKKVKEFTGKKKIVAVFCSTEFFKKLNQEDN